MNENWLKRIFFSCKPSERPYIINVFDSPACIQFEEALLDLSTAEKARGFAVVSIFAGDDASAPVSEIPDEYWKDDI